MTGARRRTSRITLVVNAPTGKSETFLRSLVLGLAGQGYCITVHALRGGTRSGATKAGVSSSAGLPALSQPTTFVAAAIQLLAKHPAATRSAFVHARSKFGMGRRAMGAALGAAPILATAPDAVHFAFSGIAVALADATEVIRLARPDVKVLVSCRGTAELVRPVTDATRGPALAKALSRADTVHAVSQDVATQVRRLTGSHLNVEVISPAVDPKWFRPPPLPPGPAPETTSTAEPPRLMAISVARLHWVKGLADLLGAMRILVDAGLDVGCRVVGDGPERESLVFRTHVLDLTDRVEFLGSLTPDRVREELRAADVFALSSLSEGISNSVLEAMAVGLPVVATQVGGMAELITDGVDGRLVPPGSPSRLAGALSDVLTDDALDHLGAAGRARVLESFTIDQQLVQWNDLYRTLLDSTGSPTR